MATWESRVQGKCMLEFRECSVASRARSASYLRVLSGVLALFAALYGPAGWSQATCTWNQDGPGQWDNPSNWNNCAGGNGSPGDTPGPADHAIVGNTTPSADIDLGATSRNLDRLTLSAGRIFGNVDVTISNRFDWTGGSIAGGAGATTLVLGSGSAAHIAGDLHRLEQRSLRNLGTMTWAGGDISLEQDAEIDNQGVFIIDIPGPIRSGRGVPTVVQLFSDGSPAARWAVSSA